MANFVGSLFAPRVLRFATHMHGARRGIVTTRNILDLTPHICPRTKFVMDLDEFIFRQPRALAGRRWQQIYVENLVKQGFSKDEAFAEAVKIFRAVQQHTKVLPMEEHTVPVMRQIHREAFGSLALTARAETVRAATERQLREIDVEFTHGIIYAEGAENKPARLQNYFAQQPVLPERVVYGDDNPDTVRDVVAALQELGLQVIGLHYERAHEHEQDFDFEIAELQRVLFDSGRGALYCDESVRPYFGTFLRSKPGLR